MTYITIEHNAVGHYSSSTIRITNGNVQITFGDESWQSASLSIQTTAITTTVIYEQPAATQLYGQSSGYWGIDCEAAVVALAVLGMLFGLAILLQLQFGDQGGDNGVRRRCPRRK